MRVRLFPSAALPLAIAVAIQAGEPPRLKAPRVSPANQSLGGDGPRRLAAGRFHAIVQFRAGPAEDSGRLERLGARPLRFVPPSGYLVSLPDGASVDGPDIADVVRLAPENKLSPLLPAGDARAAFVVEFHPDVDENAARALVRAHLLALRPHPDLLPHHLLVEGPARFVRRLAEWDEVAYVFPASRELVEGRRAFGCPGAAYAQGLIGQYIAQVGPGWQPRGADPVRLGLYFAGMPPQLCPDAKAKIERALAEWSRYVQLDFVPAFASGAARSIDVLFAAGDHGDGYPFDGRGRVLAHTFYPAPPSLEPVAGDMHFDDAEPWGDGENGTLDLFSIALHEAGHAIGLGHSDDPEAVMYPYYRRYTGLMREDIDAIRRVYAAREEASKPSPEDPGITLAIDSPREASVSTSDSSIAFAGAVQGGTGDVTVLWSSDRGASGFADGARTWRIPAVPLDPGANEISVRAVDSTGNSAAAARSVMRTAQEAEAPELAIDYPASGSVVPYESLVASGTASCSTGVARLTWSNSRGGNGTATGGGRWTAGPIALAPGPNGIAVRVFCNSGASASKLVTVTYAQPAPRPDTVPPSITILSPMSRTPWTWAAAIAVRGMAADDTDVVRVSWSDSVGNGADATGTDYWDTGPIPLRPGANTITIRAFDAAGNSGWRTLVVTRRPR